MCLGLAVGVAWWRGREAGLATAAEQAPAAPVHCCLVGAGAGRCAVPPALAPAAVNSAASVISRPPPTHPPIPMCSTPSGMKALQKAFAGTGPRLIAVVKKEDPAMLEQLQQASKANADLAVIVADLATGTVGAGW